MDRLPENPVTYDFWRYHRQAFLRWLNSARRTPAARLGLGLAWLRKWRIYAPPR